MITATQEQVKPTNLDLAAKEITYPYFHWRNDRKSAKPTDSTLKVELDFIAKGNRIDGTSSLNIPIYRLKVPFMYDFYEKSGDDAKMTGVAWSNDFGLRNGALCFGKSTTPAIQPHNWGNGETPYTYLFFTDAKEASMAFAKVCQIMAEMADGLYTKWDAILKAQQQENNILHKKNCEEFEVASQLKEFFSSLGL
jgi:hypothetical protein